MNDKKNRTYDGEVEFDFETVEQCLKGASTNIDEKYESAHLLILALFTACSLTDEERKSFVGVVFDKKSLRKVSMELGRDKHTIKQRVASTCAKIRQSPIGAQMKLELDRLHI